MTDTPIRAKARTLKDYARHDAGCASLPHYDDWGMIAIEPCSCGLDALLREADPAIDPAKLASSREADPPAGETRDRLKNAKADDPLWDSHKAGPHGCACCRNESCSTGCRCHERFTASPTLSEPEREKAEMVRILKSACDRDWSDETPIQVANIAANAIYWRDREIGRLKSAAPVSAAAQPEEHKPGCELFDWDSRSNDPKPACTCRTPLPVRQRIEQAFYSTRDHVQLVRLDNGTTEGIHAGGREALIILRDDHVERLKAAAELCVTQAVNDGRRYHWRGYAEAMEDMKLVIKDLLSSLTDQETTR